MFFYFLFVLMTNKVIIGSQLVTQALVVTTILKHIKVLWSGKTQSVWSVTMNWKSYAIKSSILEPYHGSSSKLKI